MAGLLDAPSYSRSTAQALAKLQHFQALQGAVVPTSGIRQVPVIASGAPTLTWYTGQAYTSNGFNNVWTYSNKRISAFGGIASAFGSGYVLNSKYFTSGGTPTPDYWSIEAIVDDDRAGAYFYGSQLAGIRVQVDGQLVSATMTAPQASGGSIYAYLKIDFAGVRQPRRITIEGYGANAAIIGFLTGPLGIIYPTKPDPFKLMFMGDSVCNGIGATWGGDGYPRATSQLLGVTDFRTSSTGGTGFTVVGGQTGAMSFVTRLTDVQTNAPDALIVQMSSNDYPTAAATLTTAVLNFIAGARVWFPKLPIFLIGPLWNDGSLATAQAQEAAITTAITSLTDPLVAFTPSKTSPDGRTLPIWGTGTTTAPNGSGSSDWAFDGPSSHPSTEGHFAIARFVAQSVRGATATMIANLT